MLRLMKGYKGSASHLGFVKNCGPFEAPMGREGEMENKMGIGGVREVR